MTHSAKPAWQGALAALLLAAACAPAMAVASFEQTRAAYKPSDTLILDRSGVAIQRLRTDSSVRRGQWVALADVSPALRSALLLSEDRRFYQHSGVDWRAVPAAAWGNLWNTRTRGASTISMQLAGLLEQNLRRGAGGRSLTQKLGQTVSATLLERSWRKDQILEAYLNLVPFRGELVGIDALSRTLFDKAANGLDEDEAALAAALVRAPNAPVKAVSQRACGVARLMREAQLAPLPARAAMSAASAAALAPAAAPAVSAKDNCVGMEMLTVIALQRKAYDTADGIAPHFARQLLRQSAQSAKAAALDQPAAKPAYVAPAALVSSVRAPLQRFAVQTLQQQLRELRGRNVEDGALVVLDNASGEVLAWVGSSGQLSAAGEVDGVLAQRQPGSTLKPFLYAEAIAERRLTAASLLEDTALNIPTAGGLYIPQNYDHHFKGTVSARTALAASLNVPAVRTLVMVSPTAFQRQLKAVGLALPQSGDYYGYSLALGSAEVSLLGLTNAFRTLGNGGRYSPVSLTRRGAAAFTPALDPRAAFIVGDILADPLARTRTFGIDSVLGTRFWSAVKTGTSKDMRDNWAVGYSQRYTVGVWIGNASGASMWDVSGTTGAAPVWAAVMGYLHKTEGSRAPAAPPGVTRSEVSFGDNLEAARAEWFIDGTEQSLFARADGRQHGGAGVGGASGGPVRILAPQNGTIIALDPDIPPNRQRLGFSAEGRGVRWLMDGKEFARGAQALWLPWPGRHRVQLLDGGGKAVDEIRIEVRGAGVRPNAPANGRPAPRAP